jgi:hypothetical protein
MGIESQVVSRREWKAAGTNRHEMPSTGYEAMPTLR